MANEKRSNINIVFAGKTNVGKSSLFNKLAGYERSIVANKKGTTRDTVEIETTVGSLPVTLVDTAGIRETKETVEKKGSRRGRHLCSEKDSDLTEVTVALAK